MVTDACKRGVDLLVPEWDSFSASSTGRSLARGHGRIVDRS